MTDPNAVIRFGEDGLIPAAIEDAVSGELLMIGFMNREALDTTRSSRFVHFWSRSRQSLWKKGETSGHVQRVQEIRVNCDRNSLLIEVEQTGAVCHDGYDTCYYRRLEDDDSLTIIRDRRFDPRDVYHVADSSALGLATLTKQWWRAYEWLRDHDLSDKSSTSRHLRAETSDHSQRIADELRELVGVLDGSHRHTSMQADLRLEARQVLYWTVCASVHLGMTWDNVHPDLALNVQGDGHTSDQMLIKLIESRAGAIEAADSAPEASQLHDTITLVATAMASHDIEPEELIQRDLVEMRTKPYLARFFESNPGQSP